MSVTLTSPSFATLSSGEEKKGEFVKNGHNESNSNRCSNSTRKVLRYSSEIQSLPTVNLSGWFERPKSIWFVRRWLELRGHTLYYRHTRHSQAQWVVDVRECNISAGIKQRELMIRKPNSSTDISLYASNIDEFKLWFCELKRVADNIFHFYHLNIIISHVKCASIFLGRDKKQHLIHNNSSSSDTVSVFRYDRRLVSKCFMFNVQHKNGNMKVLKIIQDHPFLLSVYDIFETSRHVYLVTETIFGNTLYDTFLNNSNIQNEEEERDNNTDGSEFLYVPPFSFDHQFKFQKQPSIASTLTSSTSSSNSSSSPSPSSPPRQQGEYEDEDEEMKRTLKVRESDLCKIAYDILSALDYLHSKNLIHGRLDMNQVIFTKRLTPAISNPSSCVQVRVITYENLVPAAFTKDKHNAHFKKSDHVPIDEWSRAPEVLCFNMYTSKSDIFSVGVMLFQMLTGEHPFYTGGTQDEFLSSVSRGPYGELWNHLPAGIHALLKGMLQEKKEYRPSARMCLLHQWFVTHLEERKQNNDDGDDDDDDDTDSGKSNKNKYWTECTSELYEGECGNEYKSDIPVQSKSNTIANSVPQNSFDLPRLSSFSTVASGTGTGTGTGLDEHVTSDDADADEDEMKANKLGVEEDIEKDDLLAVKL